MRNFIPKEFRFSHKFSFFLHDLLVNIVAEGEKAKIFNTTVKFKSPEITKKVTKMNQEEFWDWLSKNDKVAQVEIMYKQIIVALLSDFCHFVYEGLKCSEKAKITVSYALLRKPFKDNLLIFEWLLAEPEDFMSKFYSEDSLIYNPQKLTPERKKEIIKKAIDKTPNKRFDADVLYDLRYNRSHISSFSGAWDKANHLVTTFDKIKTEKQNINFVFLNPDTQYSEWLHLYSWLPILLLHSFEVVESLLLTFAKRDPKIKDTAFDQCLAGFVLWGESVGHGKSSVTKFKVNAECSDCKLNFRLSGKQFLKRIFDNGFFECKNCGDKAYLGDIIK
jgi:hypothetical protein